MCLFIIGCNQFSYAQIYGKWVIPIADEGGSSNALQLTFSDPVVGELVSTQNVGDGPCAYSAGGYNANYDLHYFVVNNHLYAGSNNYLLMLDTYRLQAEYQIISTPGSPDHYIGFATSKGIDTHNGRLTFNEIYSPAVGQATVYPEIELRSGIINSDIAFAITKEEDGEAFLYAAFGLGEDAQQIASLRRWTISSTGVTNEEVIIDQSETTYHLPEVKDYDAYNMECKTDVIGNHIIAWTHGILNLNQGWDEIDEIVVVINNSPEIFDLNLGRIGGIEFSTLEDNIIYVSCTNVGIVKLNYITGVVVNLYSPATPDYSRTFLQTAPDGHIYGVSNDGTHLGRILQSGTNAGTFEAEGVLSFPYFNSVSTYKIFTDPPLYNELKYYILPENDRVYVPLQETVVVEPESCPDMYDGEVWITVTGGAPFQSPNEPYLITCQPEVTFTWDEENHWFHGTGLTEGIYEYTITDAYNNVINGEFVIEVDYSDYTFIEHHTYESSVIINNEVISFAKGFTVLKDVNVTFNNCTLLMGVDAKIIIEHGQVEEGTTPGKNGAVLTLNNTTVTNHARCNLRWQGIEVSGFYNQSQLPGANGLLYQGRLVVTNESVIENAWNAVTTSENGVFGTHGGIIRAENSTFRNNKRSVEILSYQNFNPYIGVDARMPYSGMFKKCTFEYTDEYIQPMDMNTHVSIWNVWYINFYGCKFYNNTTNHVYTGYGIYSLDAGYRLVNYCNSMMYPCPVAETVKCEFKNLFTGIHASNAQSNNNVYVNDADFENNSTGIYLSNVDNAVVINSRFYVGPNYRHVPNCGEEVSGFGIDNYMSSGFVFENNKFFKYTSAPTDKIYTGIHVKDCPSEQDIIYNNEFTGISYGNYAEKMNRSKPEDDKTGVEYQCNENADNLVDFIVAYENPDFAKIRDLQGSAELASGNTFSQNPVTDWHFQNLGKEVISLYYYDGIPEQIPTLYTDYYVNPIKAPINLCPDHYGGSGSIKLSSSQRIAEELVFANNLADYNAVHALVESLADGGNTTSELLDIETAQPDDMWVLRTQLLGDSPHLSKEVLMAMSDRTDVLPDDVIFDILAANPDELKEDTLIRFLENKENPLPDYMISILKQLALSNTSYKTILLNDMAKYFGNKAQAAKSIVQSILADSIVDQADLRNWLDNMENLEADKQIVSSYLAEGDTTNALALLNLMPSLYELQGEQLDEFTDYKDLLLTQLVWKNQGKTIFDLDSTDIVLLDYYANNTAGEASYMAKNILSFAYNRYYCDCLNLYDSLDYKSVRLPNNRSAYDEVINISASPNPASIWVAFNYTLLSIYSTGRIQVTDVNGRLVATFEVNGKQGQQLWDTRSVGSGLYVYTLNSSGFSSAGKVVVK